MMNWTDSQRQAIYAKGGSVIVSAAAGSGKTAVLVERVISRITDTENPIDADKILVVTYTRAAAAQLKERLTKKLSELIKEDPFNKHLLRQKTLLNKAHISTIHGFCSSVIKEFFYVLNIERNFRIADDSEIALIKSDALRLTLDSMYANAEPDFFRLVEAFSSHRDDKELQKVILKIYEFLVSHPYPQWWIDEKLKMFSDFASVTESAWYKLIIDYAKDIYSFMENLVDSSYKQLDTEPVISEKLSLLLESDAQFLERLEFALSHPTIKGINDVLDSFVSGKISGLNEYKDHPAKLTVQANRKAFKDKITQLKKLFAFSEQECKEHISELYVISTQLFNCVNQFTQNFQRLKAMKKVADYSDLEHWTIKLLVDENTRERTDVAIKLSSRFEEIMVDEYQDANETQDLIFSSISNNNENLFFVGDVKQSIYGFRQAMPQLFLNRKKSSFDYNEDDPMFPAKILLDMNFRSINGVTDIVNFYFSKLMSESVGDIRYDNTESLKCGAKYDEETDPSVEYYLLDQSELEEPDTPVLEAEFVAEMIHRMISERYQVKDGDSYRDVTYGDFAVLMRKKANAPVFTDTLISYGIPAFCEVTSSFINAPEINNILNLLCVIDNPALDVELLSVLMSPMFGFTPDDLVNIRCDSRYSTLYRAVLISAQNGCEKCQHFIDELSYYRDICVVTPVSTLLDIVYERTGYVSIMSALTQGDMAESNLRLLKDYAKNFENGGNKGLSRFVNYLIRLKQGGEDIKASKDVSSLSLNAVRVMSVHASKGLEFPVCILADTNKQFSSDLSGGGKTKKSSDTRTTNVLLHSDYGVAIKHKDEVNNVLDTTMPREALALCIKRDEMSEELRVLYVAMTRAKQKLIMISSHKNVEQFLKRAASKILSDGSILPYSVKECSYLSDWLAMCALIHPDGKEIREISGYDIAPDTTVNASMRIQVIKLSESDYVDTDDIEDVVIQIVDTEDSTVIDTLKTRTEYLYQKAALAHLPSKVSASELSHRLSDKVFDRILDTPAFMNDSALSAADRGTALHEFMQFCDFASAKADLESEIKRLTDSGYLSLIQADSIDREKAERFINSSLIERCINSDKVYKEFRFTIKVDAKLVDPQIDQAFADEKIILQGAVDLAFVENNELVIVDYKTDRVKDIHDLYDVYHNQLKIYKTAMEQCTDYKVKECLIYSIHLGQSLKI